jgi:hypothetical protein
MKHSLRISTQKSTGKGLVATRCRTIREKLLRFLLGAPYQMAIIMPGNSIEKISIIEGGEQNEKQ